MPAVIARLLVTAGALVPLVAGCVSSPDENGAVVAPAPGIVQPEAGASGPITVSAAAACTALTTALAAAKKRLGCAAAAVSVPDCSADAGYLAIAGSMPCDEYDQGSVNACVAAYGAFAACADFDTSPCVITAVPSSCHAPAVTADAGHPDAAEHDSGPAMPTDASTDVSTDAPVHDGSVPQIIDAASSDAGSADASATDAQPSDASPG
jgi:hypothetical protein